MKKTVTKEQFNEILKSLSEEYDIYAPVTSPLKGTFSDTDLVKYEKIEKVEEINLKDKSQFSAKEIILPITQRLFYFTEKEFIKPDGRQKKALIILRSCDLHAVDRVDNIYLNNKFSDPY
ncbi:MAG: anaerobic sulfite reductase subunit A, partial [Fusobacteriaceae bacterium]